MFSVEKVKEDFPIFERKVGGKALVYLDNAATSQKPKQVLKAICDFYGRHNANVHRGIHTLSEEATEMYEEARKKVAGFMGATSPKEIVFTKGATESLNRIAFEWAMENVGKGDVILTTEIEHHSNLVPWQIAAERTEATLEFLEINSAGEITLEEIDKKLNPSVKLVAISHASNVLGTINPIKQIRKKAPNAVIVVDGAQAIPHTKVNVQSLGCDFYAFSGHKMLGPMGIGVLWGRKELLDKIEPYEYGGGMIEKVTKQGSTWTTPPEKFEAGTPNVAGAVGLAAAIDYLEKVGLENIVEHEQELTKYALERLLEIEGIGILGPLDPKKRVGLVSFTLNGLHAHDIAAVLSEEGIAVRSGHHCAMPLHNKLEVNASVRASLYLYNTKEDIDKLVEGLKKAVRILS